MPEAIDAFRLRKMLGFPERTCQMRTVDTLLPDSLLADARTLQRVACTPFASSHPSSRGLRGMHLACGTLSLRVVDAFLRAVGANSPAIHVRSNRGKEGEGTTRGREE